MRPDTGFEHFPDEQLANSILHTQNLLNLGVEISESNLKLLWADLGKLTLEKARREL